MSRYVVITLAALAGVVFGFGFSQAVDPFFHLKLEPSLTFGNALQSAATLLAAVVVALYLQPRTQADRKEKEILFRQIDLLIETTSEIEKFKDGGAITEIVAVLKKFSVGVRGINEILKYLGYPASARNHVRLEDHIKIIRKLTTETPISAIEAHAKAATSNSVKDGIIELAAEKRVLLDSKLHEVKMRLLKAQIAINEV